MKSRHRTESGKDVYSSWEDDILPSRMKNRRTKIVKSKPTEFLIKKGRTK